MTRVWYRSDYRGGYSSLRFDGDGRADDRTDDLAAKDLPPFVAAQCDAIKFSSPNCVEVLAA